MLEIDLVKKELMIPCSLLNLLPVFVNILDKSLKLTEYIFELKQIKL
jgi:hypothetical protein